MDKEKLIKEVIENFTEEFHNKLEEEKLEVPEITDDDIEKVINEFFKKENLTAAERYLSDVFDEYVEDTYEKINWNLDRDAVKETDEYKAWRRHSDVSGVWHTADRDGRQ